MDLFGPGMDVKLKERKKERKKDANQDASVTLHMPQVSA